MLSELLLAALAAAALPRVWRWLRDRLQAGDADLQAIEVAARRARRQAARELAESLAALELTARSLRKQREVLSNALFAQPAGGQLACGQALVGGLFDAARRTLSEGSLMLSEDGAILPLAIPRPVGSLTGRCLSGYVLEELVGCGGFGQVYKARSTSGAVVAVKVPHHRHQLARILREAELLAGLEHPGIVPCLGMVDSSDCPHVIFAYVDGPSLRERLRDEGPLPSEEVADFLEQILGALEYAHGRGVCHLDLKPENLLLDSATGRVRIVDFGLGRQTSQARAALSNSLSRPSLGAGTPAYMAPEQRQHGVVPDGRADLWALAVVAYELLTGEPPVGPVRLKTRLPGLKDFFDAAYVSDPQERVASAREALGWLRRAPRPLAGPRVRLLCEYAQIDPRVRRLHALLEVVAPEVEQGDRAPLCVVLCLDVSGSMHGEPLRQVVRSVKLLAEGLQDTDALGLVTFSKGARVVLAPSRLTPSFRRELVHHLAGLRAEGATNLQAGLEAAASVGHRAAEGALQLTLLLSDGWPNEGCAQPKGLARLVADRMRGQTLICLGYGRSHSARLLGQLAEHGRGSYVFIPDPELCANDVALAVGNHGVAALRDVCVNLTPREGVRVARAFLPRRDLARDRLSTIAIGNLAPAARVVMAVELELGKGSREPGGVPLIEAHVIYRLSADTPVQSWRSVLEVNRARTDGACQNASVVAEVALLDTESVRRRARRLATGGSAAEGATLLHEQLQKLASLPGFVADDGSPLAEAYGQLCDESRFLASKPGRADVEYFQMSQAGDLGETTTTELTEALTERVVERRPKAALTLLGRTARRSFELHGEQVLGRGRGCHPRLDFPGISRRHLRIVASGDHFTLCDLGASSGTWVNGKRVRVRKLKKGDVIGLGGIRLRFEIL